MATTPATQDFSQSRSVDQPFAEAWEAVKRGLAPIASLKLTVALFALSVLLVLIGTLAQVNLGMWDVMSTYFLSWYCWVEFQIFFPRSWFPNQQAIPGGFPFVGGATIGLGLILNLFAAHLVRFKAQATGGRLWGGLAIILFAVLLTGLVIISGHNHGGLQGRPPFEWSVLWTACKITLAMGFAASVVGTTLLGSKETPRYAERIVLGTVAATLAILTIWVFAGAYPGDSGMRILWQLIKGLNTGSILLAGCIMVFKKRGGIVMIHLGVALLMVGQWWVAKYDVEEQMTMAESEEVDYAQDIRDTELAVVVKDTEDHEEVLVVPRSLLLQSNNKGRRPLLKRMFGGASLVNGEGVIREPSLPFDVQVLAYYRNSSFRRLQPDDKNRANSGLGEEYFLEEMRPSSGADSGSKVDTPGAYVRFLEKDSDKELGVYMLSTELADAINEEIEINDETYAVALRFKRDYKPYKVKLIDVEKDEYLGTSKARSFSSDVRLVDNDGNVQEPHIWMNNPMRYKGETFYQSGYVGPPDFPTETTTLQVVTNSGWLIPYIACVYAALGMGAHFLITLTRFINRRLAETEEAGPVGPAGIWVPAVIVLLFGVWIAKEAVPPSTASDEMAIHEFGELPVVSGGRAKPFDTLARNSLKIISNYETFKDEEGDRQPAIRWLLDVIANPQAAAVHRVVRIDNLDVIKTLGLERRKGFLYSVDEIRPNIEAFYAELAEAHKVLGSAPEKATTYQRKLVEADGRLREFTRISAAFQFPDLAPLPTQAEVAQDPVAARTKIQAFARQLRGIEEGLKQGQPPLAIPVEDEELAQSGDEWQPYAVAVGYAYFKAQMLGENPSPPVTLINTMLNAYEAGDAKEFNDAVAKYHSHLENAPPDALVTKRTFVGSWVEWMFGTFYKFEAFTNNAAPLYYSMPLYVVAFVLCAASWLAAPRVLNRAALSLILFTFLIHSAALIARIYISGRPPVTNLYSSAIFIAWGGVVFGMVLEWIFKNSFGNVVASATGFTSLFIAHNLSSDGDTMEVLVAVLDTQFWLATHVVCITLGYATTFFAGGLGILYILGGLFTRGVSAVRRRELARAMYGIVCFSMFFSFVGTILGGLWADDSWGRFWGWDPKENGALIIVLWNALILHARWGAMVKDRGVAVLAVAGNIITAWSWFGVNELGVGLHSYGFTEGVVRTLGIFVASQLTIMALGMIPTRLWQSHIHEQNRKGQPAAAG